MITIQLLNVQAEIKHILTELEKGISTKSEAIETLQKLFNWKVRNLDKDKLKLGLDNLSEDDRYEVISCYCKYCGSDNPACQCWNDD